MGKAAVRDKPAPQPDVFDVVHAHTLRVYPDLVRQLGGDPAELVAQAGMDADRLDEFSVAANYREMVRLTDLTAVALRCPDFGLRLAALQGGAIFGPLGRVMRNSATFGEAMEYVCDHTYAHSLAARIWIERDEAEEETFVGHDILLDRIGNKSQLVEQLMLVGHLAAGQMTGGYARARRVHFRHQPNASIGIYRRHFDCDVLFDQPEDGIVFYERDMARPILEPDPLSLRVATDRIETEFTQQRAPFEVQARGVIMKLLGTDACTHERVAAVLAINPWTLHRRLTAEGSSFQKIKDEVRRDLMLYYLQKTDMGFCRISEKLGFSEQSVMTRRCHTWFGGSPSRVRSQARELANA
ncbi:AraC family transcriptional regulator ligand-binding domain-containing protein [Sphingomonas naphthae]|uniref:AraC family transcriptional regulator ligand-binding domain-containing protein n=1 Tax=Sphingomonas naphthae TaxID=1813468 RepID=A0ABY7TR69_9SPHN|nr:AraC family transcriptional regulator [Sphingomonas naphthae]WCT75176.1 AraC family transcriptional regulator ligand-binding domain-containing protein [Sphingomonas naphthae]